MSGALPTLPPFEVDQDYNTLTHRWKKWLEAFEDVLVIVDDYQEDVTKISARKRALLKYYVGDEVKEILSTLPDAGSTYESAITALNTHFGAQKNVDYEIYLFRQIKQSENENLDQFLTKLKKAASTCDFPDIDKELKSQIILGGKSMKLRRFILQTSGLTMPEILKYGRANETAERHATAIEQVTATTSAICNLNLLDRGKQHKSERNTLRSREENKFERKHQKEIKTREQSRFKPPNKGKTCSFCGEAWHKEGLGKCKARGKTCNACNKENHLEKVCKWKTYQQTHKTANMIDHDSSSDDEYVLANYNHNTKHNYETTTVKINNTNITVIIDTGATVNLMNRNDFDKIYPKPWLNKVRSRTYSFGSMTPLKIDGTVSLVVEHRDKEHQITFQVTSEKGPSLIGKDTAIELGVIEFVHSINQTMERKEIQDIIKEYEDIFGGIGKHKTSTIKLHIDKMIQPITQCHRRIPFHVREMVEKEIHELLESDIIEQVPENEPTTWLSPIVVRPKKDDSNQIRICVDMKAANSAIKREHHLTPTIDDVIYDLNDSKIFSKLDLNKGYHQLELHPESRPITTFSTHIGMFRYKRLSFGINSAAELFQNEIHKTIQGIPGVMNVSDDVLIYGKSEREHDQTLRRTLEKLKGAGLTLNKKKCRFSKTKLRFLGHIFTDQGMQPDPDKIKAIQEVKSPNNPTEARSFLGLTNFCNKFIPELGIVAQPIRKLTKKKEQWKWGKEEETAFQAIKNKMSNFAELSYFNKSKHTVIWVDAGPTGLGAVLTQKSTQGEYHTIAFASHMLNETELRYSQIEKEALAITWAIKHFHLYVYGKYFEVITDHQPLLPLFNKANQHLSSRLERWKFKLQQYNFLVLYQPGRNNPADYLSRHPRNKSKSSLLSDSLAEHYVNFTISNSIPNPLTLQEIKEHTKEDKEIQEVIKNIHQNEWSKNTGKGDTNALKAYNRIRVELSTDLEGSVLLRGTRLVIPKTLQNRIIKLSHTSHQGITKTKAMLREKIWFPGMDKLVERAIARCHQCQAASSTHAQPPLKPSELPSGPWKELNIDHKGPLPSGEYLLVLYDQYSKFPVVEIVPSTSTKANITAIDRTFAVFGTPETIHTDNGAPFNSKEFADFLKQLGIKHKKITPNWPRANGSVERFNKTINKILRIANEFRKEWKWEMNNLLRDYRTTPHSATRATPAELLFNYRPNNRLPDARNLLHPIDDTAIRKRTEAQNRTMEQYHNSNRQLIKTQLHIGDTVLIKQPKPNKMRTQFDPNPYKITDINGTMVTAERSGKRITRNISYYKIIERDALENTEATAITKETPETTDPEREASSSIDMNEMINNPMDAINTDTNDSEPEEEGATGKGHSLRRNVKPPQRLIEQ